MINVVNNVPKMLEIEAKDGEVYYIRPMIRGLRINIELEDIKKSSRGLVIKKV